MLHINIIYLACRGQGVCHRINVYTHLRQFFTKKIRKSDFTKLIRLNDFNSSSVTLLPTGEKFARKDMSKHDKL